MSNGLNINGVATGGSVYKMPSSEAALKAIKNDGRDQIVVKADNQIYVIEGEKLDLSGMGKTTVNKKPEYKLNLDGHPVSAELLKLDDEVSSTMDGFKKAATGVQVGFVGLLLSEAVTKAVSGKVLLPATPRNSAILLGVMGTALAAGALYGATRQPSGSSQVAAQGQKIN